MTEILDKIIELCDEKINDTLFSIHCHIMHERDGSNTDYSVYSEVLGNAYIVKSEMESFKKDIDSIVNNLTLQGIGEWENPYLSDELIDWSEEDKAMDVFNYLLERSFSRDNTLLITHPSKQSLAFIEEYFLLKKIISDGFKKFFPTVDFKKMTTLENGETILSDWTEKDQNNSMTDVDLKKIGLVSEFDSFISKANSVKNALIAKTDPFDVLVFIRDN
jgi:hypothetical protein